MLIDFRVENHRSIRDEQVLTMETGRIDDDDERSRLVSGYSEELLPIGVLYGANASGKSNVLAALQFMRDAVIESHRIWEPDAGVPRDPFAWGPKKAEPSLFEVTAIVDDVRHQYGFVATDDRFIEEWLYAWPSGKKQVWFEREENKFDFGEKLKGENRLIEEVTRTNALFLSSAVQMKHQQLNPIFSWFRRIMSFRVPSKARRFTSRPPTELILGRLLDDYARAQGQQALLFPDDEPTETLLDQFRILLRTADFGIVDLKVNKGEPDELLRRRSRIQLKHQSTSDEAWLPLEEESRGTQMLFDMGWPILEAIRNGGLVLVDELESSLHPMLAQQIVRLFNDPTTNRRNAQLVFTTHDINLLGTTLGKPALRRDQVWLTEKDNEGATILYPLTDYKPRKAENIERGYLQGRYGAIPFLGNFLVSGE